MCVFDNPACLSHHPALGRYAEGAWTRYLSFLLHSMKRLPIHLFRPSSSLKVFLFLSFCLGLLFRAFVSIAEKKRPHPDSHMVKDEPTT
ncbi:hypothetical protein VTJ83DRAFT_2471 [Remersonia thermophila]|uniref:Transmembrane protein n=1 Tax=Remersonia thermophila TaxID=72144 RepID=A0ABR4DL44_9PEZI